MSSSATATSLSRRAVFCRSSERRCGHDDIAARTSLPQKGTKNRNKDFLLWTAIVREDLCLEKTLESERTKLARRLCAICVLARPGNQVEDLATHSANVSNISVLTSASLRPVRAGT